MYYPLKKGNIYRIGFDLEMGDTETVSGEDDLKWFEMVVEVLEVEHENRPDAPMTWYRFNILDKEHHGLWIETAPGQIHIAEDIIQFSKEVASRHHPKE